MYNSHVYFYITSPRTCLLVDFVAAVNQIFCSARGFCLALPSLCVGEKLSNIVTMTTEKHHILRPQLGPLQSLASCQTVCLRANTVEETHSISYNHCGLRAPQTHSHTLTCTDTHMLYNVNTHIPLASSSCGELVRFWSTRNRVSTSGYLRGCSVLIYLTSVRMCRVFVYTSGTL